MRTRKVGFRESELWDAEEQKGEDGEDQKSGMLRIRNVGC